MTYTSRFISEYNHLERMTAAVITTPVRKAIFNVPPGAGFLSAVSDVAGAAADSDMTKYVRVDGELTAFELFELLIANQGDEVLMVFHNCDYMLHDPVMSQYLKSMMDINIVDDTLHYNLFGESRLVKYNSCRVIFITHIDFHEEICQGSSIASVCQDLIGRAPYMRFTLTSS